MDRINRNVFIRLPPIALSFFLHYLLPAALNSTLKRWKRGIMVIITWHKPDFGIIFAFLQK